MPQPENASGINCAFKCSMNETKIQYKPLSVYEACMLCHTLQWLLAPHSRSNEIPNGGQSKLIWKQNINFWLNEVETDLHGCYLEKADFPWWGACVKCWLNQQSYDKRWADKAPPPPPPPAICTKRTWSAHLISLIMLKWGNLGLL